jgi:hypothetical protein
MGTVKNNQREPVGRAAVQVAIFKADGSPLQIQETVIEQHVIPAGASAPYRVLFPAEGEQRYLVDSFGGVLPILLRAEQISTADEQFVALIIEDEQGEIVDNRYIVSARIRNPGPAHVETARLVVTVYDEMERVAGYRVLETESLPAGSTASVQVEIVPQIVGIPLYHTLHVEARR